MVTRKYIRLYNDDNSSKVYFVDTPEQVEIARAAIKAAGEDYAMPWATECGDKAIANNVDTKVTVYEKIWAAES